MNKKSYIVLVLGILLSNLPLALQAQECGEVSLKEALRHYENGLFDDVAPTLAPCMNAFTSKQKVQAHRLISLTYLAMDSLDRATSEVFKLLQVDADFEPGLFDAPAFISMIAQQKALGSVQKVTSVSKKAENLLEAPATIVLITQEQIQQRGYTDLVQLLEDIPGFDISRFYGPEYANIYQRGFRQNNTEKTLIMIDGVEDNDLWTNWAYISRQYPMSNIQRVEVIYGPASTMYGPNAFAGVVNVITKTAQDYALKDKAVAVNAQVGMGSYATRFADVSVAAASGNVSFMATGRVYDSEEHDISSQPFFNFDEGVFDTYDYAAKLSIATQRNMDSTLAANGLGQSSAYYATQGDTLIVPTQAGLNRVRELDKAGYRSKLDGKQVGYYNHNRSYFVNAKLKVSDFTLGMQYWKKNEGGLTQFTDLFTSGHTQWIPALAYLYAKYEKEVNDKLSFSSLTAYRIHQVSDGTRLAVAQNYMGGAKGLDDLVNEVPAGYLFIYFYEISKQLRSEIKVQYEPTSNLDIVAGLEYRNSEFQGDYLKSYGSVNAQDSGKFDSNQSNLLGGNHLNVNDMGFYAQATYRPWATIALIAGARVDNNKIRALGGYGTEVSPRFAVVYTPGKFIGKAIYSKGIQNVSIWSRLSSIGTRVPNPKLGTEAIRNIELSGSWQHSKPLVFSLAAYYSFITDVVGQVQYAGDPTKTQNTNIGEYKIFGLQADMHYKIKPVKLSVYANYCYTNPKQSKTETGNVNNVIGDIATHQLNLGMNKLFWKHLNVNLRMNIDGERPVGTGTTVPGNPEHFGMNALLNTTIGYKDILPGLTLQTSVNNLLNNTYYHPGVKTANGVGAPSRILQPGRNFWLRILYDF